MKVPFCIFTIFTIGLVRAATYGRYDENHSSLNEKDYSQNERNHHTKSNTDYDNDHDTNSIYSDSKDTFYDEEYGRSSDAKKEKSTTNTTASSTNQLPPPLLFEWKYAYNPPRVNPFYCTGFYIDHPKYPGLSFAADSIQEIKWRINETELPVWKPNIIWRIRVINSTQHNESVVGANMTLYTGEDMTGSALFPLNVTSPSGFYHYRIMVNYFGQPVHCVYESVPFFVSHDPSEEPVYPGPPIWEGYNSFYYSQDPKYGMAYHNPAVVA